MTPELKLAKQFAAKDGLVFEKLPKGSYNKPHTQRYYLFKAKLCIVNKILF